jgi:hypothetical protein
MFSSIELNDDSDDFNQEEVEDTRSDVRLTMRDTTLTRVSAFRVKSRDTTSRAILPQLGTDCGYPQSRLLCSIS